MIHDLYLGHFDRQGDFIRFEKRGDSKPAWYRPVVVAPLDPAAIAELLAEKGLTPSRVPADWGLSFEEEGFLACDRYTASSEARDFVKRLALRTACDVADYSSLSLLSPGELWQTKQVEQAQDRARKGTLPKHVDKQPLGSASKARPKRRSGKKKKASR
jgi:hypothetical protein